jgi:hypothetical protein
VGARQGPRCRDRSLGRRAILANGRARATNRQRGPIARNQAVSDAANGWSPERSDGAGTGRAQASAERIPGSARLRCVPLVPVRSTALRPVRAFVGAKPRALYGAIGRAKGGERSTKTPLRRIL